MAWKDEAKRIEFDAKLTALVEEYRIYAYDPDDETDAILDGYDPNSPTVLEGIVCAWSERNMDQWSSNTWLKTDGTSNATAIGLSVILADRMRGVS